MIMKIKRLCIVLGFSMLAPLQVAADEVTDVVNDVAAKLVSQLPMDKKIVLKSLSPDETGLPEDFLRKLTSDLEAALLTASDFEINLANRLSLEEVWQEAIEFNNADFDKLFKSANADVMLMMSPRAISTGVEMAITAYALTGDNVGKTLAASGSVLLPIDLQANLGVDVNDLNQQMSQVLAEIEKVGQTGGLISNPNTYAEFYHNARILQQRGEVDLAMRNYEALFKEELIFIDTILDYAELLTARYGEDGARKYVSARLLGNINPITKLLFTNLFAEVLPYPNFDKLERRDRILAWTAWLSSASQNGTQWCNSYNGDIWLAAIKSISVCISTWTGYSYLKHQTDAGLSAIFIDPIRAVRLMENFNKRFSYPQTTLRTNKSGVIPATLFVYPGKAENSFNISRLLIPHLMDDRVEAEVCVKSLEGTLKCDQINRGVGLSIKKAQRLTKDLGFFVSAPVQTSNLQNSIACIISVSIKVPSMEKTNLPIMMFAPTYPNKAFNKSEFEFIERMGSCGSPVELLRFNRN